MPVRPWKVPKLWPSERCFILGGGPSLLSVDLESPVLRGARVIAVNCAYLDAMWADAMIFGDCRWYKEHGQRLLDFAGLKVTTCVTWEREPGIRVLHKELTPNGISEDPGTLRWNLNTGACAMNLAYHLGVSEIVLLGFDMHPGEDGRANYHDRYGKIAQRARSPYGRFLRPFPTIKDDLDRLGVRVLNATPGSALTLWPIVDPRDLGVGLEAPRKLGSREPFIGLENPREEGPPGGFHPVSEVPEVIWAGAMIGHAVRFKGKSEPVAGRVPDRAPGAFSGRMGAPPRVRGLVRVRA